MEYLSFAFHSNKEKLVINDLTLAEILHQISFQERRCQQKALPNQQYLGQR